MIRNCFLLFVICSIFTNSLAIDECTTPDHKNGRCIPITSCSPMVETLRQGNITDEVKQFLRSSQCGFKNETVPLVCCGEDTNLSGTLSNKINAISDRKVCGRFPEDRIIKGSRTDIGEYPWNALLQYRTASGDLRFGCGGSLINKRYVITAARCVTGTENKLPGQLVSVRLGEHDLSRDEDCYEYNGEFSKDCADPVLDIPVEDVTNHPGYLGSTEHDIALVRLTTEIKYSDFVLPVCLPTESEVKDLKYVSVSGWGQTPTGRNTVEKKKILPEIVSQNECKRFYKSYNISITEDHICASSRIKGDNCNVDSGGSLLGINTYIFECEGISLLRPNCNMDGMPPVYTRVRSYLGWIAETVKA